MKYWPFILFILAFSFSSCDDELDITADYKEIPLVYALFDPQDSVHYMRVSKAFLDENTSALEVAQIADSIYYQDSITVSVVQRSEDGTLVNTFFPELVDGNLIGLPKDSGTFANEPNLLYRLVLDLSSVREGDPNYQDDTYEVIVENNSSGLIARGQTKIVKSFPLSFPPEGADFPINFGAINIAGDPIKNNINLEWLTAENGREYEVKVNFTYIDVENVQGAIPDTQTIVWIPSPNIVSNTSEGGDQSLSVNLNSKSFYSFLANNIPDVQSNFFRRLPSKAIKFSFFVAGEDLYNFVRVSRAQTGITSLQATAEYTNVENGLGVISSRFLRVSEGFALSPGSVELLVCSDETAALGFIGANCP